MSTPTGAPRRPTDRAPKGGRSPYAQHVAAVEETLRDEFADGAKRVTLPSDQADIDRTVRSTRTGGIALVALLAVVGLGCMANGAVHGQVNAVSWVGLALLVLAAAAAVIVTRTRALASVVTEGNSYSVHTLTATSIEALREAPGALREAEAPEDVITAAETLLVKGEVRLETIVNTGHLVDTDTPEHNALVRLAAKSLALVAIHDQAPESASKAAAEAIAAPQRTNQPRKRR